MVVTAGIDKLYKFNCRETVFTTRFCENDLHNPGAWSISTGN